MHQYAEILNRKISQRGAKTVLYLSWARQHQPEMLHDLAESYTTLAEKIGATVAPVGIAWQKALKSDPELALHTEDRSHPTPPGTYLAASVFYATICRDSPIGLTGKITTDGVETLHLPEDKAHFLQSIAWKAVQDYRRTTAP